MAPNTTPRKRPLRFKIGVALLVVCGLIYLGVLIVLFLPMAAAGKAAVIGGTVVAAETCTVRGVAGVGKEVVQAVKARMGLNKRKRDHVGTRKAEAGLRGLSLSGGSCHY
ncbi:transporter suffix domain-containing protein [Streptomyces noursei]|uniref:transporter suffix domain-containing protein n=1 Tax=Streptomyces noursei TaxID=1971 RepID=UPI0019626371|nr:transporter suffix domain-containing protein [Streptomyces noursei]QRX90341.1 transporter suffix domain-containing protein [Streptomyces noursei]